VKVLSTEIILKKKFNYLGIIQVHLQTAVTSLLSQCGPSQAWAHLTISEKSREQFSPYCYRN